MIKSKPIRTIQRLGWVVVDEKTSTLCQKQCVQFRDGETFPKVFRYKPAKLNRGQVARCVRVTVEDWKVK